MLVVLQTTLTKTALLFNYLFCWWRAEFTGGALGLGRRRGFLLARAGNRGGRGATTGAV